MKIIKSYRVVKNYEIQSLFPKSFNWQFHKLKEISKKV